MPTKSPARKKTAAKKAAKPKTPHFNGNEIIADVIRDFPAAIGIFLNYGLHCVGCSANTADTIRVGAGAHGIPEEQIEAMIDAVNVRAEEFYGSLLRNNGLSLTPGAYEKILEVAKEEKKEGSALRIEVQGDCCDFQYVLDFDAPKAGDTRYVFRKLVCVADADSAKKMENALVDFLDGPMGTGFKIDNPNTTGCSCNHDPRTA